MKKTVLLVILLSTLLIVTLGTSTLRPAEASITTYSWIGQVHEYDPYWDVARLTVFPETSTATLTVTVYNPNDYGKSNLNISAVWVHMDWDENYNSTQCSTTNPLEVPPKSYYTFTVTFTVPSISVASNLIWHSYTIFVEEMLNASDPQTVDLHDAWAGSGFVVYSTVQKETQVLYDEIDTLLDIYGYSPSFSSMEANSLWDNGTTHYEIGLNEHYSGNFASAKTHYETALDLFYDATATEAAYDLNWQQYNNNYTRQMQTLNITQQQAEAEARLIEANATMKQAEAVMVEAEATLALAQAAITQAYAWIVFGIGFIVFGVAAVVWASKRPRPPPT